MARTSLSSLFTFHRCPLFLALLMLLGGCVLLLSPAPARAQAPAPPEPIIPALSIGPCGFIQSDFSGGKHGNFEALVLEGSNLVHYFKVNTGVETPWSRGPIVSPQATGPGCIIQSDFKGGDHGNFEAVVREGANLVHYFKVNTSADTPWQRGAVITGQATGPGCIIQSDFKGGDHGNFEVVVLEGSNLVHYFKINTSIDSSWQRGAVITGQATGPGCIIQSDFKGGDHGNFEVVALEGSNLVHYFKINTSIDSPWQRGPVITTLATGPGTLIQSDVTSGGHGLLEVLVPEGRRLAHYFFGDLDSGRRWTELQPVTSAAAGSAVLIQSDYLAGEHGNFEALVPVADPGACQTAAPCLRHFFRYNDTFGNAWRGGPIAAYTGRSQKICQMTGNTDREWNLPTVNRTESAGVWGTDLGIVAEHRGRLYTFFGDTVATSIYDDKDGDTYAATYDRTPEDCLQLEFFTKPADGRWQPLIIPGVDMEAFEVPTGAISTGGKLYVFVMTAWDPEIRKHGFSILARSDDDGRTFQRVQIVSLGKFINVSPILAATPGTSTLPQEAGLWLFGSGHYRNSPVYLAWLPLRSVETPLLSMRFFAGLQNGLPTWSSTEADAVALTGRPCVGELSSAWNRYLRRYLLLYNCDVPRGINAHTATRPWGPWSAPAVLFDAEVDGGYCHFMHKGGAGCDKVSDPNREQENGGEYGPYIFPSLTTGDSRQSTIYYMLSTWNPYEAMLMRATLAVPRLRVSDVLVLADRLLTGWEDWSWDTSVDWGQSDVAHDGRSAARVTYAAPWAGFSLRAAAAITTSNLSALDFWLYGGDGGASSITVNVSVQQTDDGDAGPAVLVEGPAAAWTHVRIPLVDLGSPQQIARVTWQDAAGAVQAPFYLADVTFAAAETSNTLYLPGVQK